MSNQNRRRQTDFSSNILWTKNVESERARNAMSADAGAKKKKICGSTAHAAQRDEEVLQTKCVVRNERQHVEFRVIIT